MVKLKFTAAISNSPRPIQIRTANSNLPWQIQIHCRNFKFTTVNLNSPQQNSNLLQKVQIDHGKFKLATANSN